MEDIHNSLESHDLSGLGIFVESAHLDDQSRNQINSQSPIFKIVDNKTNKITPSHLSYTESPDYDFPSYQINQSFNKKNSSKSENENNCINLPSSPIFSPVVISSHRFRAPSIHSLDTIAKKYDSNFLIKSENIGSSDIFKKNELLKINNVYDNLRMTDLDISWVSSMASPPPPPPGSKFNTVERATFFPEDNFQKIQPRALFSPTSDDNCGCSPLPVTSDSEDDGQAKVYKSKARLSDVCSTLTELKFKSQDQLFLEENKDNQSDNPHLILCGDDNYYPKSPVFIVKPNQSNLYEKKKHPVNPSNLDTDLKSPVKNKKEEKLDGSMSSADTLTNQSHQNLDCKEDESFLDISFTQLDKMCNSVLISKNKVDKIKEPVPYLIDIFLNKDPKEINVDFLKDTSIKKRHYYLSEGSVEVQHTGKFFSSYDEIFNANLNNVCDKLIKKSFGGNTNQSLNEMPHNKFKSLQNDKNKISTSAVEKIQSHSKMLEYLKIIESSTRKKKKKNSSDELDEEERMLKAVEEAEKTLAEETQMSKVMDEMECTVVPNKLATLSTSNQFSDSHTSRMLDSFPEPLSRDSFQNLQSDSKLKPSNIQFLDAFSTAAGSKLPISEEALKKAKEFFKKCEKEEGYGEPNTSFSLHFVNSVETDISASSITEPEELNTNQLEGTLKFSDNEQDTVSNVFVPVKLDRNETDSKISTFCTNESQSEIDFEVQCNKIGDLSCTKNSGFKIAKLKNISADAKEFKLICDKNESITKINECTFALEPVRTSTPLPFQDHKKLIKKANCNNLKKLKQKMNVDTSSKVEKNSWNDLEPLSEAKNCTTTAKKLNTTSAPDFGFMTASGLKVGVSSEALIKAKKLLAQCEIESDRGNDETSFSGISTNEKDNKKDDLIKNGIVSKPMKTTDTFYKITKSVSNLPETQKKCEKTIRKNDIDIDGSLNNSKNNSVSKNEMFFSNIAPLECKDLLLERNVGFSTASGVNISVSEKALLKAKELMEKMDDDFTNIKNCSAQNLIIESTPKLFPEVIKKRKPEGIFDESVNEEFNNDHDNTPTKPEFCSGSETVINEKCNFEVCESMTVDISSERKVLTNNFSKFQLSFTTCLGKKVEVSAEALCKAQKLMSSCDEKLLTDDSKFVANNDDNLKLNASSNDFEKTMHHCLNVNSEKNNTRCEYSKSGDTEEIKAFDRTTNLVSPSKNENVKVAFPEEFGIEKGSDGAINGPGFIKKNNFVHEEKIKIEEEGLNSLNKVFKESVSPSPKKTGIKRCSEEILKLSKRFKCIEENNSLVVLDERLKARKQQEIVINEKRKVNPLMGSHLKKKLTMKQTALTEVVENAIPLTKVEKNVSLGAAEALAFKFRNLKELNDTIAFQLDDGFSLIPNDKSELGVEEFKRGFLAGPGVQPDLIPHNWIENHYKWIVWKLANYEKDFPVHFARKALTPNNVVLQLKYRYDREIDRNHRSALKKILEKDDSSLRRLILRVCEIEKHFSDETTSYQLLLTDGWYCCPARIDSAMTKLVENGKIFVGMKLITQGAVLVNCDQGLSPLEISENVYLKIFTNSTRRAKWNARLGFQKNSCNITVNLDSISPDGGLISRIDVIVVRVYPLLYAERTSDGRRVVRNRRGEEEAESEYRRLVEQKMEIIYSKVRAEIKCEKVNKIEEPFCHDDDIPEMKKNLNFSTNFTRQDQLNKEISKRVEEKLKKENLERRDVSKLLKVKIVDLKKPIFSNPTILALWNPSEDIIGCFVEGRAFSLMNLSVNNYTRGNSAKHINTTRQTRFKELNRKCEYPIRQLTSLKNILREKSPAFGEIDLVGIVLSVQDVCHSKSFYQTIYLADSEFNFVGLSFCSSLKVFGWENILVRRRTVACTNLCWSSETNGKEIPVLQVKETSAFTENPKAEYLKKGLEILKRNLPKDINEFLFECEKLLTSKLKNIKDFTEIGEKEKEKIVTGGSTSFLAADEIETEAEASFSSRVKNSTFKKSESTFANKHIEKHSKPRGRSYFRWLPYKNI